jgi:DNA repair exonuclease SbcCD nuclease subunit
VKILFIGDPHLRINNFEQSTKFLKWVDSEVDKHRPDVVCNLGDTFHNHAILRSELLKEFSDHVNNCLINCREYWYVLGNHDQFKPKDSKYHALQIFNIPNFRLFDKVENLDSHNITVVPYVQRFEDFPTNTLPIVLTHNTFIGADYGFKREDCGVNADKVGADIIISGHIHKRQQFGKVIYPGTPFAHSASDVGQTKGLLLFDTETYKQTFLESPFPKWRGLEYEISSEFTMIDLHNDLENSINDTDKWIVKVTGPKAELAAYFKSKEYLTLISDKNVVSKSIPVDSNKQNKVSIKSTSPSEIVSEYVQKVYDGGVDKQLIMHKIEQIMKDIQ